MQAIYKDGGCLADYSILHYFVMEASTLLVLSNRTCTSPHIFLSSPPTYPCTLILLVISFPYIFHVLYSIRVVYPSIKKTEYIDH